MLDKTVDALGENTLEIALTRSPSGICGHHARHWGIGTKERAKLGRSLKLSG
jgi:hypothetical protein